MVIRPYEESYCGKGARHFPLLSKAPPARAATRPVRDRPAYHPTREVRRSRTLG